MSFARSPTAILQRLTAADRSLLQFLGERGRVCTAAEAAVGTGLPLAVLEPRLLALAVATGADLRVAQDGSVAYRFPRHLRRRLLARSWRLRWQAWLAWLGQALFRLIRLSFGLALVLLVTLVSLVLLVVGAVQLLRSDEGWEGLLQLLWGGADLVLRLLLSVCWDAFADLGGRVRGDVVAAAPRSLPAATAVEGPRPKGLIFLESAYSILFGDGDPNREREQLRWQRLGAFLRHHGGAVIAEDLAPLLDLPPPPADPQQAEDLADQAMLPVLQHFDGRPEVSEAGGLVYHFPALQVDSQAPVSRPISSPPVQGSDATAAPLRERRIPFSRTSRGQRWAYGALSGALLLLSPCLLLVLRPPPPPLAGLAYGATAYALLLVLLPLVRLALLRWHNRRITRRNQRRVHWRALAVSPCPRREEKRAFARRFAQHRRLEAGGLAYTTEADLLEQQIES
jgi:hypothetical protein